MTKSLKKKKIAAILFLLSFFVQSVFLAACSGKETPGVAPTDTKTAEPAKEQDESASVPETVPVTDTEADTNTETNPEKDSTRRDIQAPKMTREEYPKVDGSTATIPLSTALYQLVTGVSEEEARLAVEHTKTTNAYRRLMYGEVDLVIAYEPAESVYEAMEESGQELIIKPIGKDALVFMTNEGNPVPSLTASQLLHIYTGKYKDWSQVGGEHKEIMAFQRPVNSGSQTLMEKLVMKGAAMAEAPISQVIGDMGELIEQVASYNNEENALGYSVYFYARNMYQVPGLRFLAVDGVMPDNETIKSGEYPYVNEFYGAVRADEPKESPAYQLFQWLTTEDGQALIESLGYVGMEEAGDIRVEVETAENPKPGTLTLKEGLRILADGSYLYGSEGIVVLDHNLAVEKIITDKVLETNVVNIMGNEAAAMKDKASDKWGLYSIEEDRWVMEPVYDRIDYGRDQTGTLDAYKGEECYKLWKNEKNGQYEALKGWFHRVGNYWWQEKGETYEIFEGEELPGEGSTPVRVLDFSGKGYRYGYDSGDYFVVIFDDGNRAYDAGGELVFGEEKTKRKSSIRNLNSYWAWSAEIGGEQPEAAYYIYNLKQGRIITLPGDKVEDGYGFRYFSVVREGEKMVLDENGERVYSSDGKPFDRILGRSFCGRWENGVMTAENPATGQRYEIACGQSARVYMVTDKIIYCYEERGSDSLQKIYLENTPIVQGKNVFYCNYGNLWEINGEEGSVLVNEEGDILYRVKENERIAGVYPEYLLLQRGNYLCFTDYQGTCGFRALSGYMGDD